MRAPIMRSFCYYAELICGEMHCPRDACSAYDRRCMRTLLLGATGSRLALHLQPPSQSWGGFSTAATEHASARVFSSRLAACAASSAALPGMGADSARRLPHAPFSAHLQLLARSSRCIVSPPPPKRGGASARRLPHAPRRAPSAPGSRLALHLQLPSQAWGGLQHRSYRMRRQRASSAPGLQLALHLQLPPQEWGGGLSPAATARAFSERLQLPARSLRCIISWPPQAWGDLSTMATARAFSACLQLLARSLRCIFSCPPKHGGGFSTAATARAFSVRLQLLARSLRCIFSCPPKRGGGFSTTSRAFSARLQLPAHSLRCISSCPPRRGGASAWRLLHASAGRL